MVEIEWRRRRHGPVPRIVRLEPEHFKLETTTVWTFPERGDWASHTATYRGNWAPEIPRNLILRYTRPGDTVLDPMMGGGTTLVECLVSDREGIGVDVEARAVDLAAANLNLGHWPIDWEFGRGPIRLFLGDARNLNLVADGSVHLVALHPPYGDIIQYGDEGSRHNLSGLRLDDFVVAMRKVAAEAHRVLAPGRHCAALIGDTRRHKHYVPLSIRVLEQFLDAGFILREEVIKLQHKMKTTREKWGGSNYDFYLIAHEHLYVFRKPGGAESISKYRYSAKWW